MNIKELKLRYGWKKIPILFYFQGMFFRILLLAIPLGLSIRILNLSDWIGFIIIIPWSIFWGWKSWKKYENEN